MKTKKPITQDRILQLAHNLTRGIHCGSRDEWIAVAQYYRDQRNMVENQLSAIQPTIAAFVAGNRICQSAMVELEKWLDRNYPRKEKR